MRDADALNVPVRFAAGMKTTLPNQLLGIGGLTRAGTSTCERHLHRLKNFFIADEFHGLRHPAYVPSMHFLADYAEEELSIWRNEEGRSWRGFDASDLIWRRRRLHLITLLTYTRLEKFKDKNPEDIVIFGLKLPGLETCFADLFYLLSDRPVPFIYCVRSPEAILRSRWTMPWTKERDQNEFVNHLALEFQESMAGLDRVYSSGCPVAVWRTPMNPYDVDGLLEALGLKIYVGSGALTCAMPRIDEWPESARRDIAPLADEAIDGFLNAAPIRTYIDRFGLLGEGR